MKKAFFFMLLMGAVPAVAAHGHYSFSDELSQAIMECHPHSEDLLEKNPELLDNLSRMARMYPDGQNHERFDFPADKVVFNIHKLQGDKCEVFIKNESELPKNIEYHCLLSAEAQMELASALKLAQEDKIPDSENERDEFLIRLMEVLDKSCESNYTERTEEEDIELFRQTTFFPDSFRHALSECEPDSDTLVYGDRFLQDITILGKEKGKCHIKTGGFHLYLDDSELFMSNYNALIRFLANEKKTKYRASYRYEGTLFALGKCDYLALMPTSKINFIANADVESSYGGDIKTIMNVDSTYDKGKCILNLTHKMKRNGKVTDYSLACEISKEKVSAYLTPYIDVLKQDGPKMGKTSYQLGTQTEAVSAADKELLEKIYKDKLCQPKS